MWSVYDPDSVIVKHAQFWLPWFRSNNVDFKDAPRSWRPIVENIDKIIWIVVFGRHATSVSNSQELNVAEKTIWNHLN